MTHNKKNQKPEGRNQYNWRLLRLRHGIGSIDIGCQPEKICRNLWPRIKGFLLRSYRNRQLKYYSCPWSVPFASSDLHCAVAFPNRFLSVLISPFVPRWSRTNARNAQNLSQPPVTCGPTCTCTTGRGLSSAKFATAASASRPTFGTTLCCTQVSPLFEGTIRSLKRELLKWKVQEKTKLQQDIHKIFFKIAQNTLVNEVFNDISSSISGKASRSV